MKGTAAGGVSRHKETTLRASSGGTWSLRASARFVNSECRPGSICNPDRKWRSALVNAFRDCPWCRYVVPGQQGSGQGGAGKAHAGQPHARACVMCCKGNAPRLFNALTTTSGINSRLRPRWICPDSDDEKGRHNNTNHDAQLCCSTCGHVSLSLDAQKQVPKRSWVTPHHTTPTHQHHTHTAARRVTRTLGPHSHCVHVNARHQPRDVQGTWVLRMDAHSVFGVLDGHREVANVKMCSGQADVKLAGVRLDLHIRRKQRQRITPVVVP